MTEEQSVVRLDVHQRIQHVMMMASFILCGVTGWPIRTAEAESSLWLADFFGGILFCRLLHRGAALLMVASSVYHLIYLGVRFKQRRLNLQMVPHPRDFVQLFQNIAYLLRLRREPPDFGRWTYWEKFDYWAVFWGMVIMGGTGFILWYPVESTAILPGWAIHVANVVHADEALLALLAIFVWHLYNVHLRPGVWPMSRIWIDGKMPMHELQRFHPAEYRALTGGPEESADGDETHGRSAD